MYIKNIRIKNFRGIKDMNWTIKSRLLAIIGPSDSTKTTILDAIEMVLTPSWNIPINDYDFFNGQVNNDIVIELTIGEIPKELLTEEKYGLFVRKFVLENDIDDEPNEMDEVFLTLRLTINEFYEESWKVVNNRSDGKEINYRDRAKLNMGRVGENFYKDFSLTRNSVLNKYGDDFREIDRIILNISRNNKENFKLEDENLKSIVDSIKKAMREYSIAPKNDFVTRLDIKNSDLNRSNISIYDGEVPIILNGTGTKRLMSSAMNINQMKNNSIVLIDELEYGLEPYRIRQLLVKLNELSKNGQVIFTSHSPIVMLEMQCTNISICRSYQGKTTCLNLEKDFQDIVRSSPEALLSKKVIVAEGRTECGILKALDTYIGKKENYIEYYGTSFIDGGGKNTTGKAEKLQKLGYDVLLFIDSDAEDTNKQAEKLKEKGVKVVQWGEKNSTEQQIFMDMPLSSIGKILQVAIKNKGREAIIAKLKSDMNLDLDKINEKIEEIGEENFRKEIGKSAKSNEWFKNEDIAENLGEVIFEYYNDINNDSDIKRVFREIKEWAYGSSI